MQKYTFNKKDSETAEVWKAGFFNDYEREFLRTFDEHYKEVINNFIKYVNLQQKQLESVEDIKAQYQKEFYKDNKETAFG